MTYKVVPFVSAVAVNSGAQAAASQLQALIDSHAVEGWEYLHLEHVTTYVAGDNGCFGFGAKPSQTISVTMAVFRK
jgi:hypothetical protein